MVQILPIPIFLLWAFKIPVDYLVLVQIIHPSGNLLGPLHKPLGRYVPAVPEQVEEGSVRAVLHHDAEHRGLDADAPVGVDSQ